MGREREREEERMDRKAREGNMSTPNPRKVPFPLKKIKFNARGFEVVILRDHRSGQVVGLQIFSHVTKENRNDGMERARRVFILYKSINIENREKHLVHANGSPAGIKIGIHMAAWIKVWITVIGRV